MNQEPKPIVAQTSTFNSNLFREPPDFSLVLGGPLFQLFRRSHLSGDALMPLEELLKKLFGILFQFRESLAGR